VLAVLPTFRNRGLGRRLLERAEETARAERRRGMSLIVADANAGARRLYERAGYREAARRPMVKEGWSGEGREWVLLTRPL
jgi:ribosomal protein S18 acetylase RimI-like enzyme